MLFIQEDIINGVIARMTKEEREEYCNELEKQDGILRELRAEFIRSFIDDLNVEDQEALTHALTEYAINGDVEPGEWRASTMLLLWFAVLAPNDVVIDAKSWFKFD